MLALSLLVGFEREEQKVENGVYRLTRKGGALKPVREYIRRQGRFRHWTDAAIEELEAEVREGYERLLQQERDTAAPKVSATSPVRPAVPAPSAPT